jgi:hypothetical protein
MQKVPRPMGQIVVGENPDVVVEVECFRKAVGVGEPTEQSDEEYRLAVGQ